MTGLARQQTEVSICYTNASLVVQTRAQDNQVFSRYSGCNTQCWNDDVLEVFAAPGAADATLYHEIDVGPGAWGVSECWLLGNLSPYSPFSFYNPRLSPYGWLGGLRRGQGLKVCWHLASITAARAALAHPTPN